MSTTSSNAIAWFEIPVADIARAQAFYARILDTPLRRETIGAQTLAVFAYAEGGVGGCLVAGAGVAPPSTEGALVYLPATPTLDAVLQRVPAAGGKVSTPKVTLPGDMGCFAHIVDSEGNRVGLHAMA